MNLTQQTISDYQCKYSSNSRISKGTPEIAPGFLLHRGN